MASSGSRGLGVAQIWRTGSLAGGSVRSPLDASPTVVSSGSRFANCYAQPHHAAGRRVRRNVSVAAAPDVHLVRSSSRPPRGKGEGQARAGRKSGESVGAWPHPTAWDDSPAGEARLALPAWPLAGAVRGTNPIGRTYG